MTFISYAQNFEDIMLWRALKHIKDGFYIDIGANDPEIDSVTLAFYERGWRGINVEPMRQYYEKLCSKRPEDINLPLAVGDAPGELTFYDVANTGLSTVNADLSEKYASVGHAVSKYRVEVTTLTEICDKHVQGPIHFLKIDVEGFEKAVLRGLDFQRWRPWILVIEATSPQAQTTNYEEWENLVLDSSYQFAYFDGLNRYYVAQEHQDFLSSFNAPPNFFDYFQLREDHAFSYPVGPLKAEIHHAKTRMREAEARVKQTLAMVEQVQARLQETSSQAQLLAEQRDRALKEVQQTQAELQLARHEIAAIYASTSWRITRPIRQVKTALRNPHLVGVKLRGLLARGKALGVVSLSRTVKCLAAQALIRHIALRVLSHFPALKTRMKEMATRMSAPPSALMPTPAEVESAAKELPAIGRRVFADLQRAIDKHS